MISAWARRTAAVDVDGIEEIDVGDTPKASSLRTLPSRKGKETVKDMVGEKVNGRTVKSLFDGTFLFTMKCSGLMMG